VTAGTSPATSLSHNNRNGTFTRILSVPPVNNTSGDVRDVGDYDTMDSSMLFFFCDDETMAGTGMMSLIFLYHNNGTPHSPLSHEHHIGAPDATLERGGLGRLDNDGWLDLFVANFEPGSRRPETTSSIKMIAKVFQNESLLEQNSSAGIFPSPRLG